MNINRVLQVLIGKREAIRRSFTCGTITTLLMAVFSIFYDFFIKWMGHESTLLPIGQFTFSGVIIAGVFKIVAATITGNPIGWLFIRPIAEAVQWAKPNLPINKVWYASSFIIWLPLGLILFYPTQNNGNLFEQLIITLIITIWIILSAILGGIAAAKIPISRFSQERNYDGVIGGVVTGGLLSFTQFFFIGLQIVWLGNGDGVRDYTLDFLNSLTAITFVATLLHTLTLLLPSILSQFIKWGNTFHFIYLLASGIIWMIIAVGFIGFDNSDFQDLMSLITYSILILGIGLSGALGSWAVGEFRGIEHDKKNLSSP